MKNASRLVDALENQLLTITGGWANDKVLAEFKGFAHELMKVLDNPQCRQKLADACDLAEVLYRTRRHQRRQRGTAHIHHAMLADLASIRSLLPSSG